eukprot:UN25639
MKNLLGSTTTTQSPERISRAPSETLSRAPSNGSSQNSTGYDAGAVPLPDPSNFNLTDSDKELEELRDEVRTLQDTGSNNSTLSVRERSRTRGKTLEAVRGKKGFMKTKTFSDGYGNPKKRLATFMLSTDANELVMEEMEGNCFLWNIKPGVRMTMESTVQVAEFMRSMLSAMGFVKDHLSAVTKQVREIEADDDVQPTHVIQNLLKNLCMQGTVE